MKIETPTELEAYESVKIWLASLEHQSKASPEEHRFRLRALADFCAWSGLDPDAIVQSCLLKREGQQTKISLKGRRLIAEKISEFQNLDPSLSARERARRGNAIRSFLIHNGILLQAGMQI